MRANTNSRPCRTCNEQGRYWSKAAALDFCGACAGAGSTRDQNLVVQTCSACHGFGKRNVPGWVSCADCNGTGYGALAAGGPGAPRAATGPVGRRRGGLLGVLGGFIVFLVLCVFLAPIVAPGYDFNRNPWPAILIAALLGWVFGRR